MGITTLLSESQCCHIYIYMYISMQSCRQEDEARRPGPKMSQIATNGLSPPSSIVSRGLSGDLSPSLPSTNPPDTPPMDISDLSAAPIPKWTPYSPEAARLYAPNGQIVVPGVNGPIYLDDTHILHFEDGNLPGKITPSLTTEGSKPRNFGIRNEHKETRANSRVYACVWPVCQPAKSLPFRASPGLEVRQPSQLTDLCDQAISGLLQPRS